MKELGILTMIFIVAAGVTLKMSLMGLTPPTSPLMAVIGTIMLLSGIFLILALTLIAEDVLNKIKRKTRR